MAGIKDSVDLVFNKIKNDTDFETNFRSNPMEAVSNHSGLNLPTEQLEDTVEIVKETLDFEDIINNLKRLFQH